MKVAAFLTVKALAMFSVYVYVPAAEAQLILVVIALWFLRPVSVLLHELGHLVVARALGFPVRSLELGDHEALHTFSLGSLRISVMRGWSKCGRVRLGTCGMESFQRTRSVLVSLAGLGANLAVAVAGSIYLQDNGAVGQSIILSLWLRLAAFTLNSAQGFFGWIAFGDLDSVMATIGSPPAPPYEIELARFVERERYPEALELVKAQQFVDSETPAWKSSLQLASLEILTGRFSRGRKNCEDSIDFFLAGRDSDSIELHSSEELSAIYTVYISLLLLEGIAVKDALLLAREFNSRRTAQSRILLGTAMILNGIDTAGARHLLSYADSAGYSSPNLFEIERIRAIADFVEGDVVGGRARVGIAWATYPARSHRLLEIEAIAKNIRVLQNRRDEQTLIEPAPMRGVEAIRS